MSDQRPEIEIYENKHNNTLYLTSGGFTIGLKENKQYLGFVGNLQSLSRNDLINLRELLNIAYRILNLSLL